ncbi:MAG: 5-(carboxyamino)imidazole ribonucleotide synthase [Candidatus Eremiobacteraeota bacterium]|nr:5-(carboxyamino)imidazole ribonucleotide synthase [Candidatus Eremiobacteraeota bacterium]
MIETIGVIGGGQLGRMMALDAKRMGYYVVTLDPGVHSPCGQVSDAQIVAQYDDLVAIAKLGEQTDVVTYEFENISIEAVHHLERSGYYVAPSSDVLRITQNRILEKQFVRDCGIAVAPFAEVGNLENLRTAEQDVGFPAVLKTVVGGYDGKGQWVVQDAHGAGEAFSAGKGQPLIFEQHIAFDKELGIVCTRNAKNEVVVYPVTENVHDRGILTTTVAPARIADHIAAQAADIAENIAIRLAIVGTFCVEFFLTGAGELLVNEIAPRPHNSGHYTIDATRCSQYEQHIRAICGLPLAAPKLFSKAVMMNILGQGNGNHLTGVPSLLSDPAIVLHMYGKKHAVERRKMGHFTLLTDDLVEGTSRAKDALALLSWH